MVYCPCWKEWNRKNCCKELEIEPKTRLIYLDSIYSKALNGTLEVTDELLQGVVTLDCFKEVGASLQEMNRVFSKYLIYLQPMETKACFRFHLYLS
jgi:hypothetical protein